MKARVPSIGSMIQQYSASRRSRAELLADDAVRGMELCGKASADGGFGVAVGVGDRIEQIASFMVNRAACPEMRQYDRAGLVGQERAPWREGSSNSCFSGVATDDSLKAVLP